MITIKNQAWEIIKTLEADVNKTLLKQLQNEWIEIASACYTGICWACMCNVDEWVENIDKTFKWEPGFPLAEEELMTCIAWIKNKDEDIVLRTIY